MIYNLDGMFETPKYKENTHICIHHNSENEDYPPHWHSPIEIVMPIENEYTVLVGNTKYVVKPYELLFIGSGVIHSTIAPPTGDRYFFQIDIHVFKNIAGINAIFSFMGQAAHFTPENSPDIHRRLVKLFEEICLEYYSSGDFDEQETSASDVENEISESSLCEPIIYAKLLTMLTLIGRKHLELVETDSISQTKKKEYADKIMTICSYIDEHFTEDITLEEVAAKAGYSKYHFSRLFKQFTKASFYKYVNQRRISYAEELLSNPDYSVTQIAIQCGFSSTSAFIRMFKQTKNCTPTDFRKLREKYSFGTGQNQ